MKRLWRKLTFGNSGSAPAERVVNVVAVIIMGIPALIYYTVDAIRERFRRG